MHVDISKWKHVFKLDPNRFLSDDAIREICLSGTHAIMVGGSSGVTMENTNDLLQRIRCYQLPCILEVSSVEAIVPGFDAYFIPCVMNTTDMQWMVGQQHQAIRAYGSLIDWNQMVIEGYVILNKQCTAAIRTEANTDLHMDDIVAYATMAEHVFHFPVLYLEYSGTFGNMEIVHQVAGVLEQSRLFYGGGIDSLEKARLASQAAHTIVVGNIVYDNLASALETVQVLS